MPGGYYNYLYGQIIEWAEKEGVEEIEVEPFSDYAIANNLPLRPPLTQKQQTMKDVAIALQKKTFIDAQGNKVRARHALRTLQPDLPHMPPRIEYVDPRTSRPQKVEAAMDQSFEQLENFVRRHAIETQSNSLNSPYQWNWKDYNYDFSAAADDARLTGKYDDELGEDFDDLD